MRADETGAPKAAGAEAEAAETGTEMEIGTVATETGIATGIEQETETRIMVGAKAVAEMAEIGTGIGTGRDEALGTASGKGKETDPEAETSGATTTNERGRITRTTVKESAERMGAEIGRGAGKPEGETATRTDRTIHGTKRDDITTQMIGESATMQTEKGEPAQTGRAKTAPATEASARHQNSGEP